MLNIVIHTYWFTGFSDCVFLHQYDDSTNSLLPLSYMYVYQNVDSLFFCIRRPSTLIVIVNYDWCI
jgi:hypothetical protein